MGISDYQKSLFGVNSEPKILIRNKIELIVPVEQVNSETKTENSSKPAESSKDFIKDILLNLSKSILTKGSNEIYAKMSLNLKYFINPTTEMPILLNECYSEDNERIINFQD